MAAYVIGDIEITDTETYDKYRAGVPATVSRYDGMIHGFTFFTKILPEAKKGRTEVISALRRAFTPGT